MSVYELATAAHMRRMVERSEILEVRLKDVTLHGAERRKPPSLWRSIQKAVHNGTGKFRFYSRHMAALAADGTIDMIIGDTGEFAEEARRAGKQIRFVVPEGGIPLRAGDDLLAYAASRARKSARLAR